MDEKKQIEIRWHARGGQGAKTAASLFADALIYTGKYVQAFPDYGPERTGAPIRAYNRISNDEIRLHCTVYNPDILVVLDPTLLDKNIILGLKKEGIILINTSKKSHEISKTLNLNEQNIYTIDASKIAKDLIGKNIPNTVVLGALVKILGLNFSKMIEAFEEKMEKKFKGKRGLAVKNIEAIKTAYKLMEIK